MIEVVRFISLSVLLVACGHPAPPAAIPPAPEPVASGSAQEPAPSPPSRKPSTCAEGRDDSPPGGDGFANATPPGGKASICIGDITTDSPVDVNGLRASLVNNITALKLCYEHALDDNRDLGAGVVAASMFLLRSGTAFDVRVEGFVPSVSDCVARELAHTAFPFLANQAHVTVAITFSPPPVATLGQPSR